MSAWFIASILLTAALVVVALGFYCQRRTDAKLRALFGGAPHNFNESLGRMGRELSRARRHNRPLSVVVLQITALPAAPVKRHVIPTWNSACDLIGYLTLGAMVRRELRDYDVIAYQPELNRYLLLLAECNQQQARATLRRISERVSQSAGVRLETGVAEFPTHGFVLEDLRKHAELQCTADERPLATAGMARVSEGN